MSNKLKILIVGPKKSGKSGIANYLADPANFGSKTTNKTYLPTVSFVSILCLFFFFILLFLLLNSFFFPLSSPLLIILTSRSSRVRLSFVFFAAGGRTHFGV